jgi:DNA-directed RNA polymerase subunit L
MPIFDIVERALYNIERKCTKYSGELPPDVRVVPADARMKGFDFYFPNEDHTLGNLLQAYMDANMMDTNEISYVGYKVPHPLRAEMVLRVGVDFERDKARDGKQTVARAAISRAAAQCAIMFREWREDWVRAKTRPIGMRNRESLRLNVANARALEQAAALVAPRVAPVQAPPGARRQPQKSAFYGKLLDRASGQEAPGGTPAYSPAVAPGAAAAGTPAYAPRSPLPAGWEERRDNSGRVYWTAFSGAVISNERPTGPPTPPFAPSTTPLYGRGNNNNNTNLPPPAPF